VTKKDERNEAARAVFLYWVAKMGKNPKTTRFTPGRRKKVLARLREGYSEDRIRTAIDGCASSDFHMARGYNRDGSKRTRRYTDLTLICRNGEKLEWFEEMASDAEQQEEEGPQVHGGVYREPGQDEGLARHFEADEAELRKEVGDDD